MKKWLVPLLVLLVISSCKNNNPEPQVNVIMPLGASRVQGSPPAYLSYRYDLWKKLRLNGYNIDFIGGEVDGEIYPLVNEEEFDGFLRQILGPLLFNEIVHFFIGLRYFDMGVFASKRAL